MHLPDRPRYFGGEANEFELGLAQVPPRLSTGYGCCRWQVPVEKVTVPFSVLGLIGNVLGLAVGYAVSRAKNGAGSVAHSNDPAGPG